MKKEGDVYWIGYTINPTYARQGYAKEVVDAIIKWIGNNGGSVVKAGVLAENSASIKLLEKMGFTYLGKEDDELIYACTLAQSANLP